MRWPSARAIKLSRVWEGFPFAWRLPRRLGTRGVGVGVALLWVLTQAAQAAELEAARQDWLFGRYPRCLTLADEALRAGGDEEEWRLVQVQCLLTVGRYPEAYQAIMDTLARSPRSIRLRWLAREVLLYNAQPEQAAQRVEEITQLVAARPWAYRDPANLVVYGRSVLLRGADPKLVLDKVFEAAKLASPALRDVYLASGDLALEKHDFALAAQAFQAGLQKLPEDPDLHCGLARAYETSDRKQMLASLGAALQRNTNHVPSLLLLADHQVDAEDYPAAGQSLDRVVAVNPWHPEAWAYRAVLAHLRNRSNEISSARTTALRFWKTNPRVDHLIGLKLSQNYRFAQGVTYQRQALGLDKDYGPAKAQLARDLLRLGEEEEGWRWAEEVHNRDAYDVAAYNLVTLRETMRPFANLTNQDFVVRMVPQEALLYGTRVLETLGEAKRSLSARYGLEPSRTTVEIFPRPDDFAVRTFGLPANSGYLGVCFGRVITAHSPAAHPGRANNWESMLWHEYAHVVTLQLTGNQMPRWLSEGISVYEERQANPAWGERLNPRYREMILAGESPPASRLSQAFLAPPSALDLQFAYYQSSLVVEFLVERFGLDRLKAILGELGRGAEINQALAQHTAPLATLDKDFAAFARQKAEQLAPGLDWTKPNLPAVLPNSADALNLWAAVHPTNYWALSHRVQDALESKQWQEAKAPLRKLIELYPASVGTDNPYRSLASVHRTLRETNEEFLVLTRWVELDGEAPDAYLRLMELAALAKNWPVASNNARRFLAVNPLVPAPYRYLAQASEAMGKTTPAVNAYRALLELDPENPAEIHFRLAQLLDRAGDPGARRHLLQALEEAPRHPAGLRLLLKLNGESVRPAAPAATDGKGGA